MLVTEGVKGLNRNGSLCMIRFSWPTLEVSVDANHLSHKVVVENNVTFGIRQCQQRTFQSGGRGARRRRAKLWLEKMITRSTTLPGHEGFPHP